jgi:cell division protein FtsW (lipid II flippase)
MLVCTGMTTVIATQTFLNIGGVTKLIPLTGITLPFISQGGSSLLATFVGLGLLLAVSDGAAVGRRSTDKRRTRSKGSTGKSSPRSEPRRKNGRTT